MPIPVSAMATTMVGSSSGSAALSARILRHALEDAGFANIVECALNDSEHAPLRNVSHDERAPAGLVDIETITFEATKPLAGQGRTEPGQPQ